MKIDELLDGKIKVFSNFSESDIFNNFDSLYQNKFPTILKSTTSILNLSKILFSLYLFSGLLGFVCNWFIHIFGLERRFTIFQFSHKWHYLTNSNKKINHHHKLGDIYAPYIDIITDDDSLFTGRLHEVVVGKDSNVEAYALFETRKYYRLQKQSEEDLRKVEAIKQLIITSPIQYFSHSEKEDSFIYLKRIKGNLFTITSNRVKNTSMSFVKVSGLYKKIETAALRVFNLIFIILIVFSVSYIFWDYHLYDFSSYTKRFIFCLTLPFSFISVVLFISKFFEKHINIIKFFRTTGLSFLIMILLFIPYLYVFNCVSVGWIIIIISAYLLIFAFLIDNFIQKKVVNDNNKPED
ncbi:hypothetical protein [Rhinopithecimicrobium faecis]|uniref:hypothetical protein n=1 Tax=Rhinopithecimicrobium faecis TaxID=2820698 RepID=UPI003365B1B9